MKKKTAQTSHKGAGGVKGAGATRAVHVATQAGVEVQIHTYAHDPNVTDFGAEAARELQIEPSRVFKTLIAVTNDNAYVCAIIPVSHELNLKSLAHAAGAKTAAMASISDAERITGYVRGGISPLGQKKTLAIFIDNSANLHDTIVVSGGQRGMDIELAPSELARLTRATFAALARV